MQHRNESSFVPTELKVPLRRLWVMIPAVLLAIQTGCGTPAGYVLIDNTTDDAMVVEVNGKTAIEIPPQEFDTIRCLPGQYEFCVRSNGREIYREQHTLEESDTFLTPCTYLLNPANGSRYVVCRVEYGSTSILTQGAMEGLLSMAEHAYGQDVDPTTRQFVELKRYTKPMPPTSWFELEGAYYRFQQPPQSVATRNGRTEYRTVLTRVSKNDHDELYRLHKLTTPSERDLFSLYQATSQAFESLSQLAPPPGQRTAASKH